MTLSTTYTKHILLADDDDDDCLLFKLSLEELPISFDLTVMNNGEELMNHLNKESTRLPDVLFLDLNMPRKNGYECLSEIKSTERLKQLPVIIFSTSYAPDVVKQLYTNGAHYYVRKPEDVNKYREVIYHALHLKSKVTVI
ncbi:MAG: transcriptional regulator [Ferruginibacter sp.]|nr:transcriptional regulator [Ferruginibacter sp.]